MNRAFIPIVLLAASASLGLAQPNAQPKTHPNSRTPGEAEATIGGKTIAVKYEAPSANGRTIFGDSGSGGSGALLQPNTVWRAGVGNPTTLYTGAELNLGGLEVPRGQYTLYVLVDPKGWQLIVSNEKGAAASVYHKQQDLGRVAMTTSHPAA